MSNHDLVHFHRRATDAAPDDPPPGLTEEQLAFFTEQTHRAVRKATRRDRAVNRAAYVVLVLGLIVALAIPGRQATAQRESIVASGRAVAVQGCNRDFVDRQNFRATISRLRDASRENDNAEAIGFYSAVLSVNPQLDCREAERLLTDDPDAKIPTIQPYFNGAPYAPRAPSLEG